MEPESALAEFRDAFRLGDLTVHRDDHWTVSVRPGQPVLGSLVLSSNAGALGFTSLPPAAAAGMLDLISRAERATMELLGAVRINALCLMMKDPLFHFHLLPRYDRTVEFGGVDWTDPGWPGLPDLTTDQADEGRLRLLVDTFSTVDWT